MKKTLRVVGAIFIKDGKLLAARRGENKEKSIAHKFEFIGGKTEEGESDEQALARELFEETGARISVGEFFMHAFYEYEGANVNLYTYFCTLLSQPEAKEHEEIVWLDKDAVDESDWAPADAPILEELRKLL